MVQIARRYKQVLQGDSSTTDRGVSLVELLVAMMLTVILGTIVVSLFLSSSQSVAVGGASQRDTGDAANILNEASRVIRSTAKNSSGIAIVSVSASALTVYSYVDMVPTQPEVLIKVEFALNSRSQLVEKRYKSPSGGAWTLTSTRTLPGTILVGGAGSPPNLFTLIDAAGAQTSDPAKAAAVTVSVRLKPSSSSGSASIIAGTVGMPNLAIVRTDAP